MSLHELTHNLQEIAGRKIRKKLKNKHHSKSSNKPLVIEETFCDCIAPKGLLSNTLLGEKVKKEFFKNGEMYNIAKGAYKKIIFPIVEDYYYHRDERNFWVDCLPKIMEEVTDIKKRKERMPLSTLKRKR